MEITMYHYLFIGMLMFLIGLLGSVLVKNMSFDFNRDYAARG